MGLELKTTKSLIHGLTTAPQSTSFMGFSPEQILITNVYEISSSSLKYVIDFLFAKFGLNIKNVRMQAYDRAINMNGDFN